MLKNKFYKNLFQTISYFAVIMVFEILLLVGFFESLSYGQNFGWILLIISLSLIVLFFLIGFYWIFQKLITISWNALMILEILICSFWDFRLKQELRCMNMNRWLFLMKYNYFQRRDRLLNIWCLMADIIIWKQVR